MPFRTTRTILIAAVFAGSLSGCAGVLIGGAATGASVATDARTAGTMLDDETIELKAAKYLTDNKELFDKTHINFTSYNNIVLVTGEAPTEALRDQVINMVRGIEKVRKVYDQITISAPSSMVSRSSDTLITGKVKTQLFSLKDFPAGKIKVVTEKGVVFLLGLVSQKVADRATDVARKVGGVQRVVKLFEYTG
jgi:osmotically-inducible protein OsmY